MLYKFRDFLFEPLYCMNNSDGSTSGYDSPNDGVSEYSVTSTSDNNLNDKLRKFQQRLDVSKTNSNTLNTCVLEVNERLKNLIVSPLSEVEKSVFKGHESSNSNQQVLTNSCWFGRDVCAELLRNNGLSTRTSFLVGKTKELQDLNRISKTSTEVKQTLKEAEFLLKDLYKNYQNLIKDTGNVKFIRDKISHCPS